MKERHEFILGEVVKAYLDTGQAVGSRVLSERVDLGLSPASIRNAMADLERMGLLCSPHTSAGRKPTDSGLRYFVDSLMVVDPDLHERFSASVSTHLRAERDIKQLLQQATEELASLTSFAGLVSVHEPDFRHVRKIELVPISSEQILAVIVSNAGEVQNRLVRRDAQLSDSRLTDISRSLSELLSHCSLEEVRNRLVREMDHDRLRIRQLLGELKQWAESPTEGKSSLIFSGQSQLLKMPEFGVIETVRSLFLAFEDKEELLRLIEQVEHSEHGVKVFIGREHALVDMDEVSVVLSRYEGEGRVLGTLGVIGPKRMHYDRVLPIVDCTARWVSRVLGGNR
ncbi:MAG: heat-inducible transcriptional repressor HrcA [Mariprofundaceae bacterium]|nr:heat-inducible transcriptional repressor HrcA [Mariprofundaceae bacterium]